MEKQLRKLQLMQLDILKIIDRICRENNICYSLYAGTLLGAVRHKGFIPWDDDLDICMPRHDYEKFLKVWEKVGPSGYILQNKENSPHFMNSFSKIRKDHTTFLEHKEDVGRFHTGIFVDVFPVDRIPDGKFNRMRFLWNCMYYQLLTREYAPAQQGKIVRYISKLLLFLTPKNKREEKRQRLLKKVTIYSKNNNHNVIFIATFDTLKKIYDRSLLDEFSEIQFEDGKFKCFSNVDLYLKTEYGDYMQMPPEEERVWKHHPLAIDFERNYEELNENK